MPLRLEISKKLTLRSERVKCVDMHPTEPLVVVALYTGAVNIWNYQSQSLVKRFNVSQNAQPVRSARFIGRMQWIVCGSDDMLLRVFNYNTLEKEFEFEAHLDYIRSVEVSTSLPLILSGSDDMQIKLWNWENLHSAMPQQTFDGHNHYIMALKFNPKDQSQFASASLDKSIKLWSINNPVPNYSLEGHSQGVNSIDFFPGKDKPYLVSGADDFCVKIWDYQTKTCLYTLEGHNGNVSSVLFHPSLPLVISGSEDGSVKLWHSSTFKLESSLNYAMERLWSLSCDDHSNMLAMGFDEGSAVIQLGGSRSSKSSNADSILVSLEPLNGRCVLLNKDSEIMLANVRKKDFSFKAVKEYEEMVSFPQKLSHNKSGKLLAICGDGEFCIYTSQALRNKEYGKALDFCWSSLDENMFAILVNDHTISVKTEQINLDFKVGSIFNGPFIGVTSREKDCLLLLDWNTLKVAKKVDGLEGCEHVVWNNEGSLCALICKDETFLLHVDCDSDQNDEEELEVNVVSEVQDCGIGKGMFLGDGCCYAFVSASSNSLKLHHFSLNSDDDDQDETFLEEELMRCDDEGIQILNYVIKEEKLFVMRKKNNEIISFPISLQMLDIKSQIMQNNQEEAEMELDSSIKDDDLASFLEKRNKFELALQVAVSKEIRFSLLCQLERVRDAFEVLVSCKDLGAESEDTDSEKLKMLTDLCLQVGDIELAEICAKENQDLETLLMIYSVLEEEDLMQDLLSKSVQRNENNISFLCSYIVGDQKQCAESLMNENCEATSLLLLELLSCGVDNNVDSLDLGRKSVAKWNEKIKRKNNNNGAQNGNDHSFELSDEMFAKDNVIVEDDNDINVDIDGERTLEVEAELLEQDNFLDDENDVLVQEDLDSDQEEEISEAIEKELAAENEIESVHSEALQQSAEVSVSDAEQDEDDDLLNLN